jgi:hypothetical protein
MGTGLPALLTARRGALVLLVQAAGDPTPSEWEGFLDVTTGAMTDHGGTCRLIVFTDGGKPDSEMRQRALERGWRDNPKSPVVVVTDHALARGVITVFSWFGLNIRGYASNHLEQAFAHLDLAAAERSWVIAERAALQARLAK